MSEHIAGAVIQIKPAHDWGGCLAVIDEEKSYGCRAYVQIPLGGIAYINLDKSDYVHIGSAVY